LALYKSLTYLLKELGRDIQYRDVTNLVPYFRALIQRVFEAHFKQDLDVLAY